MSTTSTVTVPSEAPRTVSLSDLALVFVVIIWGTNYTVVKEALGSFPPLAFMALRFALAAVAMAVVLHVREGWKPLPRATLLKLAALGFVGNTIYQVCFVVGLSHTTAANSGLLTSGTPVVTALLGAALGVDRLRRPLVMGLALAVPGMLLILSARGPELDASTRQGDLLILGASLCWALYTVGIRSLGTELSALRVTALTMITGAPGVVLIGLPSVMDMKLESISPGAWSGMVYSALIPLVLAYSVWNRSVQAVGSSRTAIYNSGTPLVAATTAWLVRGEQPTWVQAVGAGLVISGVLVSRRR
ncbi:DMT family transporter [Vitiosangium sp. GDMCC 1.1324]|uniref:DMT family transporter n=1 Tax=Vitiosangium sp. (strain GDMCC 1.1324) TaxID=2138576 RepID=UPI000D3379F7|nr:EamA family transporter [Vitiosangium sp. GDMCC 1.1324]PTL76957.1 multidrug transporter [Vitiosangium sp. GDMCC 1.1324]